MEELDTPVGTDTLLQDEPLSNIQRELQSVPYDTSTANNEDVAPIGGTQVFNLYAVDNLENRIPVLKTVVIRNATLTEIIDALIKSDQFHDFFEQTLLDGQWLRYSTEPPYILDDFQPNTLYFNVANIDVGTSSPGVVDDEFQWANKQRQVPRKVTLTCLVDDTPKYMPIVKGSTWSQIRNLLNEPADIPMQTFDHWSLTPNGPEISGFKVFSASSVVYAVYRGNSITIKVNSIKYPFKVQRGTPFGDFKGRITLETRKAIVGYALEYNGDLLSDAYKLNSDCTIYPIFEDQ